MVKSERNHSTRIKEKMKNKSVRIELSETDEGVNNSDESVTQSDELQTDPDISTDSLPRSKSNVWNYAHKDPTDSGFAICDLCPGFPAPKRISIKGGATSTLRKHLIKSHNKTDLSLMARVNKQGEKISTTERDKLHKLLINAIVVDGRCFSDFRKSGFSRFIEYAFPGKDNILSQSLAHRFIFIGYIPPHANTVRRQIKQLNSLHHFNLIEKLKLVEHISITCDFWSNRSSKSFLVMTGHYLSASFELYSTVIDFSYFEQRHFAECIANEICKKLNRLNILDRVTAVTCDGAANMKKALDQFGAVDRLWCLGHRLHLIITNALGLWIKDKTQNLSDVDDGAQMVNHTENLQNSNSIEISGNEEDEFIVVDDDQESEMVIFSVLCLVKKTRGY